MAPSPESAALRDVVALMYRADWATLSLSATLTVRPCVSLIRRARRPATGC